MVGQQYESFKGAEVPAMAEVLMPESHSGVY
jgi:hypothetical protein